MALVLRWQRLVLAAVAEADIEIIKQDSAVIKEARRRKRAAVRAAEAAAASVRAAERFRLQRALLSVQIDRRALLREEREIFASVERDANGRWGSEALHRFSEIADRRLEYAEAIVQLDLALRRLQ